MCASREWNSSRYAVSSYWHQQWLRLEAYAGLLAAFVLAYAPVVIGGLAVVFATFLAEWELVFITLPIVLVTLPMALWLTHLCRVGLGEFRESELLNLLDPDEQSPGLPLAVLVTEALPRLPLLARVPLFVWWVAHFVAGVTLVTSERLHNELGWRDLFDGFGGVVVALCFTFASNIFLVLSIAALLNSSECIPRVWEHRVLVDLLCVSPLIVSTFAG